ncbi:MAG: hypothetical protein ABIN89_22455 [Chitinophagaceae bacterium]
MIKTTYLFAGVFFIQTLHAQTEKLIYHNIQTDKGGKIIPWYSEEKGKAYSHAVQSVWHFWDTMRIDLNGLPYYMNHQVWKPGVNDPRGIGGDQFAMAMSSWRLLYAYTGDERLKDNMKLLADQTITNGLSSANSQWPNLPFPYNTLLYSGKYDGDMVLGKGFLQPDKAGSFGLELVMLYKLIGTNGYQNVVGNQYLSVAEEIANTLAQKTIYGDEKHSPLPFKVNAFTGKNSPLLNNTQRNSTNPKDIRLGDYTSNWTGTMELFLELIKLKRGDSILYKKAFDKFIGWMKKYPLQNNRWGPFFEDISGWSDTQINAISFAQFMMNHTSLFPDWKKEVPGIFNWVYTKLGNKKWNNYGVIVINEQTAYQTPGNSHTSREASAELQYVALSGDTALKENAVRQLNWATYMVDVDGKNRYPQDENWLTDGYGDYVRHYLRAMAALPELAITDEDHILSSTSVIQQADYKNHQNKFLVPDVAEVPMSKVILHYRANDRSGEEQVFLQQKPSKIMMRNQVLNENTGLGLQGYHWFPLSKGGLLKVHRTSGSDITILE